VRTPAIRHAWLGAVVVFVATILGTHNSRADDVDTAVDAFAIGGSLVGVTIDDNEKGLVKGLVHCATDRRRRPWH
jgi:hypothetical protein